VSRGPDITPQGILVLRCLAAQTGPVQRGAVARATGLRKSNIARVIGRLVPEFAREAPRTVGRYAPPVEVTDAGRARVAGMEPLPIPAARTPDRRRAPVIPKVAPSELLPRPEALPKVALASSNDIGLVTVLVAAAREGRCLSYRDIGAALGVSVNIVGHRVLGARQRGLVAGDGGTPRTGCVRVTYFGLAVADGLVPVHRLPRGGGAKVRPAAPAHVVPPRAAVPLSDEARRALACICERRPETFTALGDVLGGSSGGAYRLVETLRRRGLVEVGSLRPTELGRGVHGGSVQTCRPTEVPDRRPAVARPQSAQKPEPPPAVVVTMPDALPDRATFAGRGGIRHPVFHAAAPRRASASLVGWS